MPFVIMTLSAIVMLAAIVLPIKWILESEAASGYEKAFFILLAIPFSILSYYLFYFYQKKNR